jgi:hypothetical protein
VAVALAAEVAMPTHEVAVVVVVVFWKTLGFLWQQQVIL